MPPALPKPNGLIPSSALDQMSEGGEEWPLLGFDAALGQGVELREGEPPGANCAVTWGDTFRLRDGKVVSSVPLGEGKNCDGILSAVHRFTAELPARGISPARNLIVKWSHDDRYEGSVSTLGVLDAPLCGWIVQVRSYRGQHKISLVSPANDRGYALGALPMDASTCVFYGEHGCVRRGMFDAGGLTGVALTPDRTRLYVSIRAAAGGHHTHSHVQRGMFALPTGVVSTP